MAIGDKLARGDRSAQFPSAGGNISQERWDRIWDETTDKPAKDVAEVKRRSGKKNMRVPKDPVLLTQRIAKDTQDD